MSSAPTFKVGDRVGWNSEAGHVSGTIIKVHTQDFDYKGHTHHASPHTGLRIPTDAHHRRKR